jgi:hypothetical protein
MTLKELEPHLFALTPAEKAQVLKLLVLDVAHAWPRTEKDARRGGRRSLCRAHAHPGMGVGR